MPFSKLDKAWSNLADYYNSTTKDGVFASKGNVTYTPKPEFPSLRYSLFDDGLIRGGVLNVGLSTLRDTARIGKFFASGKGVLFTTKQVGLQLSNPPLEQLPAKDPLPTKNQGFLNNIGNSITNFVNSKSPTQIYNLGINTLAQVAINAAGGHIIRHGKLPVGGVGFLDNNSSNVQGYSYEKVVKTNNSGSKVEYTSLTSDNNKPQFSDYRSLIPQEYKFETLQNFGVVSDIGTPTKQGGFIPGSDLAVPQTGGSMFTDEKGAQKIKGLQEVVVVSNKNNGYSLSYKGKPNRLLTYLSIIASGNDNTDKGFVTKSSEANINQLTLQSFNGGAASVYGIGKTVIKTNSEQRTNVTTNDTELKKELLNGFIPNSYSDLDDKSSRSFKKGRQEKSYIASTQAGNVETNFGVSHTGNGDKKITNKAVDSINVINIIDSKTFYDTNKNTTNQNLTSPSLAVNKELVADSEFGKDIIKFRIEFLNNEQSNTSAGIVNTDVLAFRAYIDDFQDGMNAKWNSYRYIGRGEDFYVYDGFTRDISVAFTVFAHSEKEMAPIYRKLNYLMSSFAPDYNDYNKMRGNIGYLTVGDYLYRQPGVFTDIKLSGMLDSHWEINLGGDQYELPKYIKVNMSFKPIHTFLPRKQRGDIIPSFITPDKNAYKDYIGEKGNKYLDIKT